MSLYLCSMPLYLIAYPTLSPSPPKEKEREKNALLLCKTIKHTLSNSGLHELKVNFILAQ